MVDFDYDAELCRYHRRLREAMDVGSEDVVLDIGCGTGQTTRDAAGLAVRGSALGVDVSPVMVERARRLAAELGNVRFELADAQVHPFQAEHFTLGVSRFGTMFFADPVEAFTNIRRALRPGARLVQLVWQGPERQEWETELRRVFADKSTVDSPFSLADRSTIDGVLTGAGFTDVTIEDVREPVWYGADPDAAVDSVRALRMVSEPLASLDADGKARALDRLRSLMATHTGTDGVWFDSRAWLVTTSRPGS